MLSKPLQQAVVTDSKKMTFIFFVSMVYLQKACASCNKTGAARDATQATEQEPAPIEGPMGSIHPMNRVIPSAFLTEEPFPSLNQ